MGESHDTSSQLILVVNMVPDCHRVIGEFTIKCLFSEPWGPMTGDVDRSFMEVYNRSELERYDDLRAGAPVLL